MISQNYDITKSSVWDALQRLAEVAPGIRVSDLLDQDQDRVDKYSLEIAGLSLDYSKNLVTDEIMQLLLELVAESPLETQREKLFTGEEINMTEQRPVLHTALRASPTQLQEDGLTEASAQIAGQKHRIKAVSDQIRSGAWLGSTGKRVTDIVNLGIGGSDLGPKLACEALKEFSHERIKCHFVSNVDGELIRSTLKNLEPETTLVILSSKTFTTQETLLNAQTAAGWFEQRLGLASAYASPHFIGVTASPENAVKLGIRDENILEFWDWVGGRYSLWSTIGLSIAICIGYDNFERILAGAQQMDVHFRESTARENMPVILALLGVWYSNFLHAESHAVIPYCERMLNLPAYLQQLDMESNGKSVTLDSSLVNCSTGPIIWGQTGTNGQHSFFQLLHQGTHLIPIDFIGLLSDDLSTTEHHRVLTVNMFAQSAALMSGKQDSTLPVYRNYLGNKPSNVLLMEKLIPETFGALIALYEHKVFVQGCLWNVNSFDQWGVELGKALANDLLQGNSELDCSTRNLMNKLNASL
ncbi:glucose-6-phosphate isomerase [Pseudohalioglobus lutimaris]|uniref:Glucose-6-phosphate isomerase n=1 Tax=Pseudohalioglobus lutimaris TaxID=1737061 RepID=A0A2N5X5A5_9GAMM|nr:glucose-6-phosphate isomerase [Pseudohalioglobus lutimaris]PLW69672.1 glucose-6-phosphate isomerase [Pseudohalioglobus lutimaris]